VDEDGDHPAGRRPRVAATSSSFTALASAPSRERSLTGAARAREGLREGRPRRSSGRRKPVSRGRFRGRSRGRGSPTRRPPRDAREGRRGWRCRGARGGSRCRRNLRTNSSRYEKLSSSVAARTLLGKPPRSQVEADHLAGVEGDERLRVGPLRRVRGPLADGGGLTRARAGRPSRTSPPGAGGGLCRGLTRAARRGRSGQGSAR
jgi:hypothetical protein